MIKTKQEIEEKRLSITINNQFIYSKLIVIIAILALIEGIAIVSIAIKIFN